MTSKSKPVHPVALVYLEEIDKEYKIEVVDSIKSRNGTYEIISVPFFAKHLAIGDLVTVENDEGVHYFDSIAKRSGHSTVRLLFKTEGDISKATDDLQHLGTKVYRYRESVLLGIDIPPSVNYQNIKEYLKQGEKVSKWEYEEACLGWK